MADEVDNSDARFHFIKSGDQANSALDWERGPDQVRKAIGEALNARNVAFLLGAGCSSLVVDKQERGISTMAPLAKEFCKHPDEPQIDDDLNPVPAPAWALDKADVEFLGKLGASLNNTEYSRNLERLMELLYSLRFVYKRSTNVNRRGGQAVAGIGSNAVKVLKKGQSRWGHHRRRSGPHPDGDSFIRHKELPALAQGARFGADSQPLWPTAGRCSPSHAAIAVASTNPAVIAHRAGRDDRLRANLSIYPSQLIADRARLRRPQSP
ncbi:hypothetical protein ACVIU7_009451 [Bradyrhizobium liaoningense]